MAHLQRRAGSWAPSRSCLACQRGVGTVGGTASKRSGSCSPSRSCLDCHLFAPAPKRASGSHLECLSLKVRMVAAWVKGLRCKMNKHTSKTRKEAKRDRSKTNKQRNKDLDLQVASPGKSRAASGRCGF